eukprot:1144828-Pelagomonas_calceolata.AAC.2
MASAVFSTSSILPGMVDSQVQFTCLTYPTIISHFGHQNRPEGYHSAWNLEARFQLWWAPGRRPTTSVLVTFKKGLFVLKDQVRTSSRSEFAAQALWQSRRRKVCTAQAARQCALHGHSDSTGGKTERAARAL